MSLWDDDEWDYDWDDTLEGQVTLTTTNFQPCCPFRFCAKRLVDND